jgi:hypothetical protein
MIAHLVFHRSGNIWASDERGFPVAAEQEPAWWIVIQDKLSRGVIDENTVVARDHYCDMTVGEIVRCRIAANQIFPTGNGEEVKKIMANETNIVLPLKLTGIIHTEVNSESSQFQKKAWTPMVRGEITFPAFVAAAKECGVVIDTALLDNHGSRIDLPFEVTAGAR